MRLVGSHCTVPVPAVPWQERDSAALAVPFFIMNRIDGDMVADNPPYVFGGWLAEAPKDRQQHVQRGMIDVLAGIHGVRASADELAFLQVPYPGETPLRRYVAWKKSLYEWGRSGMRFPLIERLIDWLEAHWPAHEGQPVVIWGDARPANVLWRDFAPVAVLDWEIATVGPRELDVGYMIFFHKYFQHIARAMVGLEAMPDFMRRDDIVAAYEAQTGSRLRDIDGYITYGLLHQAVTEIRITQLWA
jgi:aminoglycoside phosphotransferase (APT) family kinase protein